jgi:hypothetical protein
MAVKRKPAKPAMTAIGSLTLVSALALGWLYWAAIPPQLGDNERAFSAVDALFTAITARNEKLLGDCEVRLNALRDEGALESEALVHLTGIMAEAKSGEWQRSARRLYKFMQAQRRESS